MSAYKHIVNALLKALIYPLTIVGVLIIVLGFLVRLLAIVLELMLYEA